MPLDMKGVVRNGRVRIGEDIILWFWKNNWIGNGLSHSSYNVVFSYNGWNKYDYPKVQLYCRNSSKAGDWVIYSPTNGLRYEEGFGLEKLLEAIPKYIK